MKIHKQIISAVALLLILSFPAQAKAEQKIKSLKEPIPLTLSNNLLMDNIKIGDEVTLVVPETITCKKMELKKDTALLGTVIKTQKSKRYYKNGYFEILVNSINYPDRGLVSLKKPIDIKIYDPEIMQRKDKPAWMKASEAIFFCSDNVIPGTSLPLYIYETFKWDKTMKDKSKRYKWGIIIAKSTTVYYYADFFKKHIDPNYAQGSEVKIKFKKKVTKKLFTQVNPVL